MWALCSTSWECPRTPWTGREGRSRVTASVVEATGAQGGTQAVDRAAALLTYVVEADHPVTFAELPARPPGWPGPPPRACSPRWRTTGCSSAARPASTSAARCSCSTPPATTATPSSPGSPGRCSRRSASSTGETVHLAVANGDQVAHIAQVDSTYLLGARDWTDVEVPPHCSALGKVLLAWDVIAAARRAGSSRHPPDPAPPRRPGRRPRAACAAAATRSPATSSRSGSPASPHRSSGRTAT